MQEGNSEFTVGADAPITVSVPNHKAVMPEYAKVVKASFAFRKNPTILVFDALGTT